ncbi:MAG: CHRD domain-containing protein [bacterium]|nr:CHRD domain-containing protein [bacterium]
MNKKIVVVGACALLLGACTQKTASNADDAMARTEPRPSAVVTASESPKATNSSTYVFKLDRVAASSSPTVSPRGSAAAKTNNASDTTRLGKATFKEVDGKVTVSIAMENKAATTSAQPAHIHVGVCPLSGAIKYPLTNVVNGESETILPAGVTITTLKAAGPLAVNIHKSATELSKYIACGDLDFVRGQDNAKEKEKESGSPKATYSPKASQSPRASVTPSPKPSKTPIATPLQ